MSLSAQAPLSNAILSDVSVMSDNPSILVSVDDGSDTDFISQHAPGSLTCSATCIGYGDISGTATLRLGLAPFEDVTASWGVFCGAEAPGGVVVSTRPWAGDVVGADGRLGRDFQDARATVSGNEGAMQVFVGLVGTRGRKGLRMVGPEASSEDEDVVAVGTRRRTEKRVRRGRQMRCEVTARCRAKGQTRVWVVMRFFGGGEVRFGFRRVCHGAERWRWVWAGVAVVVAVGVGAGAGAGRRRRRSRWRGGRVGRAARRGRAAAAGAAAEMRRG